MEQQEPPTDGDEWPCSKCYDEYDEIHGSIVPMCSTRCSEAGEWQERLDAVIAERNAAEDEADAYRAAHQLGVEFEFKDGRTCCTAHGYKRQRDLLAQAMWDARGILGFDNDGDKTPAATIAGGGYEGYAEWHVRDATEARKDDDGTFEANVRLAAQVAAVRAKAEEWAAMCPDDDWPESGDMSAAVIADAGRIILRLLAVAE